MGLFDILFGAKKRKIAEFIDEGAVILDVRTKREWDNGHIDDSMHIPLNEFKKRIDEVKALEKPIITCCASGARSAKAVTYLNLHNAQATNGGSWLSLQHKL